MLREVIMDYHFNVEIAKEHGVESAIIIQNFIFWICKNKANGNNQYDGRTWTYNSIKALETLFPFWTGRQIRRILDNLVKKGVLVKGNYNKMAYDRTTWYAFASEAIYISGQSICPNGQIETTVEENGTAEKVEPIPYNKPNKKQNNKPTGLEIPSSLSACKDFLPTWETWLTYRMELRKKVTPTMAAGQLAKLEKAGPETAITMIRQSIENGWQGLFPIKQKSTTKSNYEKGKELLGI